MFGNLKERLINVSKNVKLFSDQKSPQEPSLNYSVNLNAGARILNHYQEEWEQLHELNEENARKAEELAKTITSMYEKITNDHKNITDITLLLNGGTQCLSKTVEHCLTQVEELNDSFETVEKNLLQLENLIENLELQEKQLEHRFQLALYKERKLANLEALRVDLATKHAQSVIDHELKQKQVLQERQQTFQEAFQTDIKIFKEEGIIPIIEKPISPEHGPSPGLEEIQLDCDTKDLDQFLNQ